MQRILILDSDTPHRTEIADAVQRTPNAEVVLAVDEEELLIKVTCGAYAAVFANSELLPGGASRLIGAVRSAIMRPMLIIASNDRPDDLDPELVTLVIRRPYDVKTVTGILLSAIVHDPRAGEVKADAASTC